MHDSRTPKSFGKAAPVLGLAALFTLGLAAQPQAAHAQATLDYLWNGDYSAMGGQGYVGAADGRGQVFQTPDALDTTLVDFTIQEVTSNAAPNPPSGVQFHLATWTPTIEDKGTLGTELLTASPTITPVPGGSVAGGFNNYTVTFSPGEAVLKPGQLYAAYLTQGTNALESIVHTNNPYSDGGIFIGNNGDPREENFSSGFFKADFNPTSAPEPSSVAAFGFTGVFAAGLMLKARKRKTLA